MTWLVAFLCDDEFKVLGRVRRVREHEGFLPVYRLRDGREKPLYPGYLFLAYHHRWPSALKISGVARVLGEHDGEIFRPHMLPDEFVDSLRDVETESPVAEFTFSEGDWVRIVAGAHAGLFGTFQRHKHGTGIVMVDYFHRAVPVSVPLHQLANPYGASTAAKIA